MPPVKLITQMPFHNPKTPCFISILSPTPAARRRIETNRRLGYIPSMDSACSMSLSSRKTVKSRRIWSPREEEVLIEALKDLVSKGWKTDNGFRVGYLNKLEDSMKEVFPGSDIKGQPHINSKITAWKKFYGSLSAMLRRTGVNFNSTTFMIDCPNEDLWNVVVREDTNAGAMRFKSWPFYESWIEIFGKDRATGEGAEDVMDAVNDLVLEDHVAANNNEENDYVVNLEDFFGVNQSQSDEGTSVNQSDKQSGGSQTKSGSKKRKSTDGVEKLYDIVGQLCKLTSERFQDIARYIGYEYGLGESRKCVFELLGCIPDLSLDEKLDVAEKLASNAAILEMFNGFPPDDRARYVGRLLGYGAH